MQPQIQFNSLAEFIAMGKHGVYIWTCWGIVLAVLFGLIMYSVTQRKNVMKQIKHNRAKTRPSKINQI